MGAQDTTGSALSFASVVHSGASVPGNLLRCVPGSRDIIESQVGAFDAPVEDGGVLRADAPGPGVTIHRELPGQTLAFGET